MDVALFFIQITFLDLELKDIHPHFKGAFTLKEMEQLILENATERKKLNFKDFVRMLCPSN
jgi:hypothetical protein